MATQQSPMDQFLDQLRESGDPFGIGEAFANVHGAWAEHPGEAMKQLTELGTGLWTLQLHAWQRLCGLNEQDAVPVVPYDARFQDPVWTDNPYLDVVKEYYLLYTRWLQDAVYNAPGLGEKERRRAAFWERQMLNALAPTNYFWTNPAAIIRFIESGGTSLVNGLRNFVDDAKRGMVSMTDEAAFEVGRNLATTPGAVVFRNELLELIQYKAQTAEVQAVPIVLVAPWINKFYILDLNEKKSLVRWLVERGFTVFVTSWKNPGPEMRGTTLDDYMLKGVLEAVNVARDICDVPHVHAAGYCLGGTITAALMAWLNAGTEKGKKCPIVDWTLFTTLVDFTNPGDIDVYVDEKTIRVLEERMERDGFLDGSDMAASFRTLRSNSLVWHYFVHNYLYGEPPPAFDVLYWNMDTTRLPQAMHSFYLRELYLKNRLAQPDGLSLGGRALDLGRITQPLYAVGTEQDHIAPWKETFKVAGLVKGPTRYVLATSGHILGIISPPVDPPKRRYWAGDATGTEAPEAWCEKVEKVPGSWWEDWADWLERRGGERRAPPALGNGRYPEIADAPGVYALER